MTDVKGFRIVFEFNADFTVLRVTYVAVTKGRWFIFYFHSTSCVVFSNVGVLDYAQRSSVASLSLYVRREACARY